MTAHRASAKRPLPAAQTYSFYTSQEYYDKLVRLLNRANAGDRVVLVSLWVREGAANGVIQAACGAARRGAEVIVVVDAFTFLIKRGIVTGPAFYFGANPKVLTKSFHQRRAVLESIRQAGGSYTVINQPGRPFSNPFKGRSHMKFTVVNNEVFIGGCNLSESPNLDLMISWRDKHTADWLCNFAKDISAAGNVAKALRGRDVTLPIDRKTNLLIDAGVPGQSVILDRAKQLVAQAARHLIVTYQYYPQAAAAGDLADAHARGVELEIVYNHHSQHPKPLNMVFGVSSRLARNSRPDSFVSNRLTKRHNYLHAKLIASEKAALLGSHNYMPSGVVLGTAEIALYSRDPVFAAKAAACLRRQLKLPG